ncbi:MAG: hypothetical protein ACXAD7_28755, partial [Candidatus Kariarchaeaceae archaeon]
LNTNQISDPEASGGAAVIAKSDTSEGIPNVFIFDQYFQSGGWFKYYIRAKSDTFSSINVGWKDPSQGNEETFVLTNGYRWYSTHLFFIGNTETISLWIHSSRFTEYIDKIMIVRFKDDVNLWTNIMKFGQVTDPNVEDSDGDNLNDNFELNEHVRWFEAEHHEKTNYAKEVFQLDASNGKSIMLNQNPGGSWIPMLVSASFPPFEIGTSYKFYVRSKGTGFSPLIQLSVSQGTNNFISGNNHEMTPDFRWYCTPKFTTSMANQNLQLQVYVQPPNEGTIFIDKLMVACEPDNTVSDPEPPQPPYIRVWPGQVSDPLDPDTDFDSCMDGHEINYDSSTESDKNADIYWFEAEDYVTDPANQILDDNLASNGKTIQGKVDGTLIDSFMIPNHMKFNSNGRTYLLYMRAKKVSANNDAIYVYYEKDSVSILLNKFILCKDEYQWYISSDIPASTSYVDIVGLGSVRLDKIMLVNKDKFIQGQMSDPLDPDIDWDEALDGVENNENVYWFEAEAHVFDDQIQIIEGVKYQGTLKIPEASNSTAILPIYIEGGYKLTNGITFPVVLAGDYQLYFRAKYDSLEQQSGDLIVVNPTPAVFFLQDEYRWYLTEPFTVPEGPIHIDIDTSYANTILDKIILVKVKDDSGTPTDRYAGTICSDPVDPDIDWDNLYDGYENNQNLWWFEAENHPST